MRRAIFALVALFSFTGEATAFFEKRTSLLLKCTTGGFNEIYCMGYIAAIFDSMTVARHTAYGLRASRSTTLWPCEAQNDGDNEISQ